ncbi:hypothetical protein KY361_01710 [Candidatus Woesearchaeota archaeon]|nr:hypothetical protein [Candidatus Woesearchaeota archaeon]
MKKASKKGKSTRPSSIKKNKKQKPVRHSSIKKNSKEKPAEVNESVGKEANLSKHTVRKLREYIKRNFDKGHSLDSIKEALIKHGYDKDLTEGLISSYMSEKIVKRSIYLLGVLSIMVIVFLFTETSSIVGFASVEIPNLPKLSTQTGMLVITIILAIMATTHAYYFIRSTRGDVSYRSLAQSKSYIEKNPERGNKFILSKVLSAPKESPQPRKIALGRYETYLDALHRMVEKSGKVKLSVMAKYFGVDRKKIEDWAAILEEHDLLKLHYPAVGEPELIKIKIDTKEIKAKNNRQ